MSRRTILVLVLLGACLCAERFAYYGMRSRLVHELFSDGLEHSKGAFVLGLAGFVMVIGAFAGAGASYAVGPRVTSVAAAALGVVGHLLSAAHVLVPAVLLVSFSGGMLQVCPFVAAAEATDDAIVPGAPSSPRRFVTLTAFTMATFFALGLASGASGAFARVAELQSDGGFRIVAIANVVLVFLATVLASITLLVGRRPAAAPDAHAAPPYRAPEAMPVAPAAPARPKWTALVAVVVITGVLAFGSAAMDPWVVVELLRSDAAELFTISGNAEAFSEFVGTAVFVALAVRGTAVTPLRVLGVSSLVASIALLVYAAGIPGASLALVRGGYALHGLAEPWSSAPLYAYAALCFRGRAAGFGLAAVVATMRATHAVATPLVHLAIFSQVGWPVLAALGTIAIGVVATVFGPRLQRSLFG